MAARPILDIVVDDKRFDQKRVLRDLRLTIAPREVVALVGASGCGKSTLLRIVAGLDRRYRGSVRLDGRTVDGITRDIGFIFQEPRLFPWLTVSENVAFESGLRGNAAHRDARVVELLDEVGLAGYERLWPKQLSGGQAQRVAIARGLLREPRVLLLDEPFSAVDAFTRIRLQDLLMRVASRHGATLLLVTHDIEEAVLLGDRVLVLGATSDRAVETTHVALPRPRDRTSPSVADLRRRVLETLNAAGDGDGTNGSRHGRPAHRSALLDERLPSH